jgi:putative transposase
MALARSSYYYKPVRKKSKKRLLFLIEGIVIEFPRYGYRRVTRALSRMGVQVNHKVVLKLMKEHGLLCKRKRSWVVHTTDSNHPYRIYPNLVKGKTLTRMNEVWAADLTYIRIPKGFAYLAVILDQFSRKIVGYALSKNIDRALSLEALNMALKDRKPPEGCIHHSDRGVQYAAHEYVDQLRANKLSISMSAKGNPYDNATAESLMKTIKVEEVYLQDYQDFQDVVDNVGPFIRDVYNAKRLHSSIGYRPPDEFEAQWLKKSHELAEREDASSEGQSFKEQPFPVV